MDHFDFARGYKFSTYATWAIRNHFAGIVREQARRRERFVTGLVEPFLSAIDDRDAEAERERSQEWRREAVAGLLGRLDDRERRIIIGRYGLDGERGRSLRELGAELGLTKERVRQLEVRAHHKLRTVAGPRELDLVPA